MKLAIMQKGYLETELKSNRNYRQIALKNNVSTTTIQRYLNKYNLTKSYKNWSETEIKLLKKYYPTGRIQLQKIFPQRTFSSIYHKANKLGLNRIVKPLKYSINEHFFNKWSKSMSYFLGWLFSDGNVSKEKRNFSLHINSKDLHILEVFKGYLKSNHPINIRNNSVMLRIHSKIMCEKLVELGCIPQKSLSVNFPEIPNRYLSHFVRGVFDGDGSIHFNKPNTIKVSVVGSKSFIETLRNMLQSNIDIKSKKTSYDNKLYICQYYGDNARKFCSWMYKDCEDLYLKRKRERFIKHIKKQNKLINGRYL